MSVLKRLGLEGKKGWVLTVPSLTSPALGRRVQSSSALC